MWPTTILGLATQYLKAMPMSGRWAKWQPVLAVASIFGLGTLLYIWDTPNAMAVDWRTFLNADFSWVKASAGITQFTSLASQIAVNFAPKSLGNMVPNTNLPSAPVAPAAPAA